MAWGQHKAGIVRTAVEGEVTAKVTASFLQEHDNAVYVLDLRPRARSRASARRGCSVRSASKGSRGTNA